MPEIQKITFRVIIAAALIILPVIVLARPADPERFPKNEPLQSMPEESSPNYQGSVDWSAEPSAVPEEQVTTEGADEADSFGKESSLTAPSIEGSAAQGAGSRGWYLYVLIILLAVSLFYGIFRWKSKRKP